MTEAMNSTGELLSEARLKSSLLEFTGTTVREEVLHVLADTREFADGVVQSDDITILVLKYLKPPQAEFRIRNNLNNISTLMEFKMRSDEMKGFDAPVIIGFPLRGEWMAPNTQGKKIPSHGTDQLGERYAFDFLQVDWARTGRPFYHTSLLRYLFFGVPLNRL